MADEMKGGHSPAQSMGSSEKRADEDLREYDYTDGDDALKAYEGIDPDTVHLDEGTRRRLLWRIDLIIMPVLCLVYGFNFLDKTAISYASVMGINKDLGITKYEYSWLGSLFYFGYLAMEFPVGRFLQYFPLAKYLAFGIIMRGVTLSCFAAVKDWPGAAVLRFFLGVLEASVMPGFTLLTSQWYTKPEQSARISLWASFNGFAQIFGGLVAYGIATGNDKHGYGIAAWKIVFLFCGLATVVVGFIFLIVIPDNQLNAWWLSKNDRTLAVERVRVNQQGIGNRRFKWYQLREAFIDPLTWAFVILTVAADIPNGGITSFFSLLVKSFGYTQEQSLLYGTPAGAVEIIAILSWGFITQKYDNRMLWALVAMTVALLGAILIVALNNDHKVGRLIGYYLTLAFPVGEIAGITLIASNTAGYTKKTTQLALYTIGYCVGNIIGPQTFRASDAPEYRPAEIAIIVCFGVAMLDLAFIAWYCRRQNKKKAQVRAAPGYKKIKNIEFLDLTDWENPELIYVY
ncbi:MAG: hypothetical protein M1828_005734 [Chrysothrix sp. TS-e1954]|nr:MAG: hypothetical protein M1828_005734 [Chrysothrix sp. TS-e1954]